MYIYIYIAIGKKTERLYLHPYKPVSWLLTHRPDEWVITKQACKDESIVSLFFSSIAIYITLYSYVSSTVKRKNQYTDFLFIYIYIYHTSNASLSWQTVYLKHFYNFTNSAFVMPSTQNETSLRRRDEWVITKQACRDEGIVSLFFFSIAVYIALYSYVSSTVKQKNQYTDFLYIYISYLKCIIILTHRVFKTHLQFYKLSLCDAFYTKWNVFEEGPYVLMMFSAT